YCAANAKPASVIKHGTEDDEIKQDLLAAIQTIKSHENRVQTRSCVIAVLAAIDLPTSSDHHAERASPGEK
ncbi:MAG: hypothetical protein JXC32_03935, partial [Anaerolineae bacterium]|nr:hypothetical protein [Anaerolineae bacterium]